MKRIEYHSYGGPEVMQLADVAPPVPGAREVAVAVRFAALNPIDWKVRAGAMRLMTGSSFPRAMGLDLSGVVTAVGAGVTRFRVGDAVFGLARFKQAGALAETAIASEDALAAIPATLTFEQAACLAGVGVTAWIALIEKAGLRAGQRVFINGCGGAVGTAAVQIARLRGAWIAGACGADAIERARALGVREVHDYAITDLATSSARYDVVFDAAGTMTTAVGVRLLRPGGTFATVEPTPARFLRALVDRRVKPIVGTPRAAIMDRLADAAAANALLLPIDTIVPLADAIALITAIEGGRRLRGKALVAIT